MHKVTSNKAKQSSSQADQPPKKPPLKPSAQQATNAATDPKKVEAKKTEAQKTHTQEPQAQKPKKVDGQKGHTHKPQPQHPKNSEAQKTYTQEPQAKKPKKVDGQKGHTQKPQSQKSQIEHQGGHQVNFHRKTNPWPPSQSLFPKLAPSLEEELASLLTIFQEIRPLNQQHQRNLPQDIADLSTLLTTERAKLNYPYWSKPNFISAYLYYFLPWNLVRLTKLLSGLPELAEKLSATQEPVLWDLGSGPLTFPLALWLAYPKLRALPLKIVVQDKAKQPLILGTKILQTLAKHANVDCPWQIKFITAPIEACPALLVQQELPKPTLISAANVLNELTNQKKHSHTFDALDDDEEADGYNSQILESLASFLTSVAKLASHKEAQILIIEPGTRLGGKIIAEVRQMAMEAGFRPDAPCTHNKSCPAQEKFGQKSWCHFTFPTTGAPSWLTKLSHEAGLSKAALSLSPLLLSPTEAELANTQTSAKKASHSSYAKPIRIISNPFRVPNLHGLGCYACSPNGLLLLEQADQLLPGDLLTIPLANLQTRDQKSGAYFVRSL